MKLQTLPSEYVIKLGEKGEIDTVMIPHPVELIEVIKGPEKYRKEVIDICKSYSKILDLLRDERIKKQHNGSLYITGDSTERPEKYWGYDGGYEGYLMSEQDKKIENIINQFIKIERIASSTVEYNNGNPGIYSFYYYRVKKNNGYSRLVPGVVIWLE